VSLRVLGKVIAITASNNLSVDTLSEVLKGRTFPRFVEQEEYLHVLLLDADGRHVTLETGEVGCSSLGSDLALYLRFKLKLKQEEDPNSYFIVRMINKTRV